MVSNVLAIAFFFAFIFILAIFRNYLTYELQSISLLLFRSSKPGTILYTIIFLPGTIVHELSHWIVAELLQVPTGEINIFPEYGELEKQEKRLGSVMIARSDPIRGFFIGMAPIITGVVLLMGFATLLSNAWANQAPVWQITGLVYGVIVLGNSMLVSRSDRRYLPAMFAITLAIYLALFKTGITLPESAQNYIFLGFRHINNALVLTLIVEFTFVAMLLIFRKLIERIFGKRVTHS